MKLKAVMLLASQEEYACSMGDYRGPKTADGRCPKCGMVLQKVR